MTPIVPAHLAVKAMRDNGYRNTAYAIAELIDNSIQHGATKVELLCSEIDVMNARRTTTQVNQIGVLDNGSGMTSEILRMALQFGNGTHLEPANQDGIGKFGMGLPSSSISQAKRVEVWTWQNGIKNIIYSYLDIDDIINQTMTEVPEPICKEIPKMWRDAGNCFENSGTLVVWSKVDKCLWKTAKSIFDNSEFLVGRMYRKFIHENSAEIRMIAFKESNPTVHTIERIEKANDPIYLMENTSTPEPFDTQAMFKIWGSEENFEFIYPIKYNGETHSVTLKFTFAKNEARVGDSAGNRSHGKHAEKNMGVSIVRAGRELSLDKAWIDRTDPRDRWWGVEVNFPPALDEVFGVTNNKQFANNFAEMAKIDLKEMADADNKTITELLTELQEEGDPKALLFDVVTKIKNTIKILQGIVDAQNLNSRGGGRTTRHTLPPEEIATTKTDELKEETGKTGESDTQEGKTAEEKINDITETLEGVGFEDAKTTAEEIISDPQPSKYKFVFADLQSSAFFSVRPSGGIIFITLNTKHPAYSRLVEVLDKPTENSTEEELSLRLQNASDGLKLLLMAWARYEDELPDGNPKSNAQDARTDWGRIAKKFLQEN